MIQIMEHLGWDLSRSNHQFHGRRDGNNDTYNGSTVQLQTSMEKMLRRNLRSHKVSLLITSTFSLAAALIVIVVVLSDARAVQQRSFSLARRSVFQRIRNFKRITYIAIDLDQVSGLAFIKQRSCRSQLRSHQCSNHAYSSPFKVNPSIRCGAQGVHLQLNWYGLVSSNNLQTMPEC